MAIPAFSQITMFAQPASPTLIAHWTFDEGATDVTGNGHDGVIAGAAPAPGQLAGALAFDGIDDHVGIPNTPLLSTVTAGPHSMSAWVFADQSLIGTFKFIIDAAEPTATFNLGDQRGLRVMDTGQVIFKWVTTQSSFHAYSDGPLTPGTWHHLVGTFDGVGGALYIDGVLQQQVEPSSGTPTPASVWDIGDISAGGVGTGYFPGRIDDVRVYSGALTADEVSQLYAPTTLGVCALFDQDKAWPGGVIPVRLRICGDDGTNLSSAHTLVTAVRLTKDGVEMPLADAGSANPGNLFRFAGNAYIFNLSTESLPSGSYSLAVTADGKLLQRSVSLRIK